MQTNLLSKKTYGKIPSISNIWLTSWNLKRKWNTLFLNKKIDSYSMLPKTKGYEEYKKINLYDKT